MKYYSTNGKALDATLEEAVVRGLRKLLLRQSKRLLQGQKHL